jgi:hypothetical protein
MQPAAREAGAAMRLAVPVFGSFYLHPQLSVATVDHAQSHQRLPIFQKPFEFSQW